MEQKKIKWVNRPFWANYIAQDKNGEWWWFEEEPRINNDLKQWYSTGKQERAYITVRNWRSTLVNLKDIDSIWNKRSVNITG